MTASTSMVIFTSATPFRRLVHCGSHIQDSTERAFGLSKTGGAFSVLFVISRHKARYFRRESPISGRFGLNSGTNTLGAEYRIRYSAPFRLPVTL